MAKQHAAFCFLEFFVPDTERFKPCRFGFFLSSLMVLFTFNQPLMLALGMLPVKGLGQNNQLDCNLGKTRFKFGVRLIRPRQPDILPTKVVWNDQS